MVFNYTVQPVATWIVTLVTLVGYLVVPGKNYSGKPADWGSHRTRLATPAV